MTVIYQEIVPEPELLVADVRKHGGILAASKALFQAAQVELDEPRDPKRPVLLLVLDFNPGLSYSEVLQDLTKKGMNWTVRNHPLESISEVVKRVTGYEFKAQV